MIRGDLLLFLLAIIIVGVLLFVLAHLTKKRPTAFDKEEYQIAFLNIENTLSHENSLSWNAVVTDADKLLDKALCEMGLQGKTMGDRLKNAKTKFTQLNSVWYAHKLRNQIAHEHGFQLDYKQAAHALTVYRQALRDLGAI